MVKLSQTSKLGCKSWSLEAGTTCPGSKDAFGDWVAACNGCYARAGNYRFPSVKAVREVNRLSWSLVGWIDGMVEALANERFFRWFDSGDMYHIGLAENILQVMEATPWCQHWLPTRMHKFAKFHDVLARMEALPNVRVRRSSDSVRGEFGAEHGSTILGHGPLQQGQFRCRSESQGGQCLDCRKCWSKDSDVIVYTAHGKKVEKVMLKLIGFK